MDDETLYLTLNGPIEDAQTAQLIQLIQNAIVQEGLTHIYLAINTPGGSVNAGIMLYHYLQALSVKITTHNVGQVDSIGNMVFLSGEDRFTSPATSFLLHGVSLRVDGNIQINKGQLKELQSQIGQDEARIEAITSVRTNLSKTQLSRFFRTGRSLSPTEAKKYGIVTEIRELNIPSGAKTAVVNTFPIAN